MSNFKLDVKSFSSYNPEEDSYKITYEEALRFNSLLDRAVDIISILKKDYEKVMEEECSTRPVDILIEKGHIGYKMAFDFLNKISSKKIHSFAPEYTDNTYEYKISSSEE